MAIRIPTLNNPQEMTVFVSGPDGANRLIICAGAAPMMISTAPSSTTAIFTFLVGPVLQRAQFVRAIASVSLTKFYVAFPQVLPTGVINPSGWNIQSADADWDDESGQVEARVEIMVEAPPPAFLGINGLSYHISILAALPQV